MIMGEFDVRMLLAWIWLLLFGMEIFEEGIKALAWKKMKQYLEQSTRWAWRSITTGTFATALLQSSSLVTLLLLWFLWAGLMSLQNGIWVIVWANVWTTVSSLLVSILWFWEFKISSFALPIIALWWLLLVFWWKSEKLVWWGKLLVWFWLLFIWIWYMKESVDALKASFDLEAYKDMSLWGFWFLWVIVTVVIQSSSAMSVMTFAALWSGIITFPASIAIVMGSNIGTTLTWVIASFGGAVSKRQLSLFQVLFNVFSAIVWIILFRQLISRTWMIVDIQNQPVFANAVLNTIFNLLTALMIAPFLVQSTQLIRKIIPDGQENRLSLSIDDLRPEQARDINMDTYITAVESDIHTLEYKVLTYMKMPFEDGYKEKEHTELYEDAQEIAERVLTYFEHLDAPASIEQWLQQRVVWYIRSLKHIKNVSRNIIALRADERTDFVELYQALEDAVIWYAKDPDAWDAYVDMLDKYYTRHLWKLALLWNTSWDEDLDSASLINMVREIEEAMSRADTYISVE